MKIFKHLILSLLVLFMFFAISTIGASAKNVISVSNEKEAADMLRSLEIIDTGADLNSPMTTQEFLSAVSGITGIDTEIAQKLYFGDDISGENITVEKASEIIFKILGRELYARETGFEQAAIDAGLLKKVKYGTDKVLTKGNAAILICNSLEIEIYEYNNNKYEKTSDTILSKYLKIEIYKGIVDDFDDSRNQVSITLSGDDSSTIYPVKNGLNMTDAVNTTVYVYYNTDENIVVAYDIYGDYTVLYDYIIEVNGYTDNTAYAADQISTIYLNKMDKKYKISSERDLTVIYNEVLTDTPVQLNYTFARIVLYKGNVVAIKAYKLTEGGLISGKDTKSIIYKQTATKTLDKIDEYDDIDVIINYNSALYSNLNADMVFDYWASDDKLYIVASDASLTGVLQTAGSDEIVLDNTAYYAGMLQTGEMYMSRNMGHSYTKTSNVSALLGNTVGVFFDSAGNARYIKNITTSSNKFFGVVTKISMDYETDYDNMELTVYGNIGGTAQSKKYKLKLSKNSPVRADEIYNMYRSGKSDSVYKFKVNDKNEIISMTGIGVNEDDELYYLQTGSKNPTGRGNLNSNLTEVLDIYDGKKSYKGVNESKLMFSGSGQINFNKGFGVMYVNTVDRPSDYVAYDVTNTECISIWDKNGEIVPTYFDWATLQGYQNKRNNFAIKIVFDKSVDEYNPVLIIMMNDSNVINTSTTRKYGIITNIEHAAYGSEYYYRMTVKDHEHKENTYIIAEDDFKEDSSWGNGVERDPMVGDFVIYTVGGSFEYTVVANDDYVEPTASDSSSAGDSESESVGDSSAEETEEEYEYVETIVSEDGTANILKLIRPKEDLVDPTNTRYYETSVRMTVIDSVYDMNNKLIMVRENGKILPVQRAAGGIIGFPTDRMRYMVIKQGDMTKKFDYSTVEDIKTEKAYDEGSKLYVISDGEDIKAVIIAE